MAKAYADQAYPVAITVKVTWDDGVSIVDEIKGLSIGHALWRARCNWDGAVCEFVALGTVIPIGINYWNDGTRPNFKYTRITKSLVRDYAWSMDYTGKIWRSSVRVQH